MLASTISGWWDFLSSFLIYKFSAMRKYMTSVIKVGGAWKGEKGPDNKVIFAPKMFPPPSGCIQLIVPPRLSGPQPSLSEHFAPHLVILSPMVAQTALAHARWICRHLPSALGCELLQGISFMLASTSLQGPSNPTSWPWHGALIITGGIYTVQSSLKVGCRSFTSTIPSSSVTPCEAQEFSDHPSHLQNLQGCIANFGFFFNEHLLCAGHWDWPTGTDQ